MKFNKRSPEFEDYLARQTPERRAALVEAEKRYAALHSVHLSSFEETFKDIMHGYEDKPAGPPRARLRQDNSDWSWKPDGHPGARCSHNPRRYSSMKTFRGVPPSAAELYGRKSYRPA